MTNNCDVCVWCHDGTCDFCEDRYVVQGINETASPAVLGQGHGAPSFDTMATTKATMAAAYYNTVVDKLQTAFDTHGIALQSGACSMSIMFKCKCSTSPCRVTFRVKSKASDADVPPDVLVQWSMAKIAKKHIDCWIWKQPPNPSLLSNHLPSWATLSLFVCLSHR